VAVFNKPAVPGYPGGVGVTPLQNVNQPLVGFAVNGPGVTGNGDPGVQGNSVDGTGVQGKSTRGYGVAAESSDTYALFASGPKGAALLQGNVSVQGDHSVTGGLTANDVFLSGADCAEEFDALNVAGIEAGSVVVFDDSGRLSLSTRPYDKRVAGVISGAGAFRPGVVLDRRTTSQTRVPVALVGKVYCKVDASFGAIELGDMLTTSATEGCAKKAQDPSRAFGATIGKALMSLDAGCMLIPILVRMA
jgi:hypothetical protein